MTYICVYVIMGKQLSGFFLIFHGVLLPWIQTLYLKNLKLE